MSDRPASPPKHPLPRLTSDAEAERFTDTADLSEFDLSGFAPVRFELAKKDARLEMRLSQDALDALKAEAKRRGIPHSRLARHMIEEGLRRSL